jgi:hypothetical protein
VLDKICGVQGWTFHDLYRNIATRRAEMGIVPHIIERLLKHVSGTISGVAAVYSRHHFVPKMYDAIKKWEARLAAILANAQRERKLARHDADELISRFGSAAYEVARQRARQARFRQITDDRPEGHWDRVRQAIGQLESAQHHE